MPWKPHSGLSADSRRDHGHRGIYMIARSHAIFNLAPHALEIVAIIGCLTAILRRQWTGADRYQARPGLPPRCRSLANGHGCGVRLTPPEFST